MTGHRAGNWRSILKEAGARAFAALLLALLLPGLASAMPFFSRQVGRDCTFCHNAFPKLNDTGRVFLYNGYRFEAEGEWREAKDISSLPVGLEVEVEGMYDRIRRAGATTESSDMKVEEVEVMAGGAFGKAGSVSVLVSAAVEQTATGFEAKIPKAFVQMNDLLGRTGAGALNLKAGIGEIGLPFLRPSSTPVMNRFLADRVLNAIGSEQRFIEVNGSVISEGSRTFSQRYRAGFSREDVSGDDKMRGVYAAWSATVDESLNLGVLARAGKEDEAGVDVAYRKYGVAAEAERGPFVAMLAYFISDRTGAPGADDWLVELLYFVDRFTLGARYEVARVEGSDGAKAQTYMARYNLLSNAVAQLEYRRLEDNDMVAGAGELEDKVRLVLLALF